MGESTCREGGVCFIWSGLLLLEFRWIGLGWGGESGGEAVDEGKKEYLALEFGCTIKQMALATAQDGLVRGNEINATFLHALLVTAYVCLGLNPIAARFVVMKLKVVAICCIKQPISQSCPG